MVRLAGKRRVPILVKDDGQPMLESMDMVAYIEAVGDPILTGPKRAEISEWADSVIEGAGLPRTLRCEVSSSYCSYCLQQRRTCACHA
jgi:glutaredoxin 2